MFLCIVYLSTELGLPRDLLTRDVTDTSFLVSWVAAPGKVRHYRITWKSLYTGEAGEKTISGDTTATVLEGLSPETRYQVSVFAGYGHGEGQALVGEETTDGKLFFFNSSIKPSCPCPHFYFLHLFPCWCFFAYPDNVKQRSLMQLYDLKSSITTKGQLNMCNFRCPMIFKIKNARLAVLLRRASKKLCFLLTVKLQS